MKSGYYVLHLTAEDVKALTVIVNGEDTAAYAEEIERVKPKVAALYDIVTATENVHEASERYKVVTGYYD